MVSSLPGFKTIYKTEVQQRLKPVYDTTVLAEADIGHLPYTVQDYVRYVGAVGKSKVHNFRAVSTGGMKRTIKGNWMEISSRQYNFFDEPARLYYIQSSLFGIPFDGLHAYTGDTRDHEN